MANVVTHPHPQLAFHAGPVNHSPSPLGFGFGLSSAPAMSAWAPSAIHSPQSHWPTPAFPSNHQSPMRSTKRRHEPDEETEEVGKQPRDDAMDRSPTPERPKRAAPKRARTTPAVTTVARGGNDNKESNSQGSDVDVGVLLASLPHQSLLPILTSLITTHPSLKSSILSLIPRPSLDTAIQAITNASKKLHDAFPYSNGSSFSSGSGPSSLGFTSVTGGGQSRLGGFGASASFGFGQAHQTSFGHNQPSPPGGMREEYIISRLRPHIADFVSTCFSYLPYFSNISPSSSGAQQHSQSQSHATALQSQHKDKSHPSETFLFLHALTTQLLSQPALARTSLVQQLLPRLTEEWKAWVDRVDEVVNRESGMFGQETVRTWERGLDDFATAKGDGLEVMRGIRDRWISKVGWLVGRQPMQGL